MAHYILEVYVACFACSTANFLFADVFLKQNFWHEIFFEFENFRKFSKIFEKNKNLKIFEKIKNLKIFEIFEKIKKIEKKIWSEKKFLQKKISIPYPNAVTSQKGFEIGPAV